VAIMVKRDFYYEENEKRLKRALLKDFKELLKPEFTTAWKTERIMIGMYLGVMSLENTMKAISKDAELKKGE
jgi:hypothetical protein